MSSMQNQDYLRNQQYHSAANLTARIQLHERFSTNPTNWQRWVFDQLAIAPDSQILELGTGSAQLWRQNLDRIPATWQITLSDFSAGMLQETQQSLGSDASRFQFVIIDAQSIPSPDASFDCVIANHMLYHVPDRARAFAEIRRVLRPSGRFYAATNGEKHLLELKQLCEQAGITLAIMSNTLDQSPFTLQNASAQMVPYFPHIETRSFPGHLAVTEAEPLLAFILSTTAADTINEAQLQTLRTRILDQLAKHGSIHITKETGLLIAC